ncbi:MAG TPA: DUF4097 family beta strand repeat-containing protein [Verrucomicrobiae bacterium]|nr:DUF4097 family beta strand repeat-containing protein [Verrucomicrobiae bacterium]
MNTTAINHRRWERRPAVIGAIVGTVLGCALVWGSDFGRTEEFHQTFPLSETGRVSLDNINGMVLVTTWDRAEVKLDAVKSAKTDEDLKRVEIIVDAKPEALTVKTRHHEKRGFFGGRKSLQARVDYNLTVPSAAVLEHINNVNGNIEIRDVRGSVNANTVNGKLTAKNLGAHASLATVNGHVTASFAKLDGVKSAKLEAVNGAIDLALPDKPNATVKASTVNGGIANQFSVPVKHHLVGNNMEAKLGSGAAVIKLSTVNGAIHVNRATAE